MIRATILHVMGAVRHSDVDVDQELGAVRELDRELAVLQEEDLHLRRLTARPVHAHDEASP
jgi:hypothetical protein